MHGYIWCISHLLKKLLSLARFASTAASLPGFFSNLIPSRPGVPPSQPRSGEPLTPALGTFHPQVSYPLCLTSAGPGALSLQVLCSQDSLSGGASLSTAALSLPDAESTPGARGHWDLRTWVSISYSLFLCPAGLGAGWGFKELLLSAC